MMLAVARASSSRKMERDTLLALLLSCCLERGKALAVYRDSKGCPSKRVNNWFLLPPLLRCAQQCHVHCPSLLDGRKHEVSTGSGPILLSAL